MKSYTDIEQSKKLAGILPLESADMVLPFRHTKKDEYIPGYVVSRNYVEVYNEMIKLPEMKKEDACKLIQPCWSIAALLEIIADENCIWLGTNDVCAWRCEFNLGSGEHYETTEYTSPIDACYELILKLNELNLL